MKKYFSTTEVAKYCKVTRFTIINWIEKGLLCAQKTAGGHRRILLSELVRFIREKNMDLSNLDLYSPEMGFKWCWEYHQNQDKNDCKNHKCRGCLVYLTHSKKCFQLRGEVGHKRIFCNSRCEDCDYYNDYFNNFQWCWEYHEQNDKSEHQCTRCVVYLTRTRWCFTLREETGHRKIFCKKNCTECSYYLKFAPLESPIVNHR